MSEITGKKRIQFFMNLLSNNLDAAILAFKDNPSQPFGYYVHLHDCRTPLFKIQALARMLDRGKKKNNRMCKSYVYINNNN